MPEQFLHGVEVIEIDTGARPIRTVKSSVIGIVGTAPNAAPAATATLRYGSVGQGNGITFTAANSGASGNKLAVWLKDPRATSSALSVSKVATADGFNFTVSLATGADGVVTSTAAQVIAALSADEGISALMSAAGTVGSSGSAVAIPMSKFTYLSGGADEAFPLNTPVLVAGSRAEAAKLGAVGTLPNAIDAIFDQTGAVLIVVRVAEGADYAATQANVIGGIDVATGNYRGVHCFTGAESAVGFAPKILIAPGFTSDRPEGNANPVVAELLGIAERLRSVIIADGPNTTDAAAITYRGDWGSPRIYVIDPGVKVSRDGALVDEPASPRVAGIISKSDNERGFWWSPSNREIAGIVGTTRQVDFTLGDFSSRANLLNEREVATIIRKDGYRLWGNRTCAADQKWAFLSVRRTADMINESILRAHMWAVDRNITRTYIEDVTASVNGYLASLKAQEAILGGECFPSPDLNTSQNVTQGKVFFDVKFTAPYPAEHVTFRSFLTDQYIEEVFAK